MGRIEESRRVLRSLSSLQRTLLVTISEGKRGRGLKESALGAEKANHLPSGIERIAMRWSGAIGKQGAGLVRTSCRVPRLHGVIAAECLDAERKTAGVTARHPSKLAPSWSNKSFQVKGLNSGTIGMALTSAGFCATRHTSPIRARMCLI
jgi:hypothetical protein